MLAARAAFLSMLAVSACSDRSAPREDVGSAALPLAPLLGPREDEWRLPSAGDFNGDGMRDILWKDYATRTVTVWLMDGVRVRERGPAIVQPPGGDWLVVSAGGDRNGDGLSDVLWHDPAANRITMWLMRGTTPFAKGPMIQGPPGIGWSCLPAGDFDGDGIPDLLWFHPQTKRMAVWLMHGPEPFVKGAEIQGPPGDGWLVGFGSDLDHDGLADVFWYDPTTAQMTVWLMNGTEVRERGPYLPAPAGPGWILAAAGDFNRDHMADPIWFNVLTKRMTISLMYGTALLEQGPEIPAPPGEGWIVGNTTDSDGDSLSEVIWLDTSPLRIRIWLMNGTVPIGEGPDLAGPVVPGP